MTPALPICRRWPEPPSNVIEVPPCSAKAFLVRAGQIVRIVDLEGRQPGDLVAFCVRDRAIRFSQARSRVENQKVSLGLGDDLWAEGDPPRILFRIVGDTHGGHDLLYPACCRYALRKRFGRTGSGCAENLAKALRRWSIRREHIPDPLNLFFRVAVSHSGRLRRGLPRSRPGSHLELEACEDCLVAVATCPVPVAGKKPSGYRIEIRDSRP